MTEKVKIGPRWKDLCTTMKKYHVLKGCRVSFTRTWGKTNLMDFFCEHYIMIVKCDFTGFSSPITDTSWDTRKKSSSTLNRRKWRKRKRKGFIFTDAIDRIHFRPKETKSQNHLIVVTKSPFPISPFTANKRNRSPSRSPLTRVKGRKIQNADVVTFKISVD